MPLSAERLAQIKAATSDLDVKQSASTGTGTLRDFMRSRDESMSQESSLFNIGGELFDNLRSRLDKASEAAYSGDTSIPERILRVAGQGAGAAGDIFGAGLKAAYHTVVPKAGKEALGRLGEAILDTDIGQAGLEALYDGAESWNRFAEAHPDAAEDLKSIGNIASLIPIGKAAATAKQGLSATARAVTTVPSATKNLAKTAVTETKNSLRGLKKGLFGLETNAVEEAAETTARNVANNTGRSLIDDASGAAVRDLPGPSIPRVDIPDIVPPKVLQPPISAGNRAVPTDIPGVPSTPVASANTTIEQAAEKMGRYMRERSPKSIKGRLERVNPNVTAKKAEDAAYDALAPESQKAVRAGLLRRDVEAFKSANPKEKTILQDMVRAADENSINRGKTHPSDLVGKEMNRRIKLLDDERKIVGKELGEQVRGLKDKDLLSSAEAKIAGKMGNEAGRTYRNGTEVVQDQVIKRLDEVPGLEGIKMGEGEGGKAVLDFTDTALSGSQSKAARDELQALFDDITGRNPYQLHRLRQEIFESLGGKKAAQLQLTETQEQGMDAIREGIADALELASDGYKAINAEYRSLVTPLKEMRKFYKGTEGAAEDVLDAKAGLLARRLTSNVASAPELRRILDEVGAQLAKRGKDVSDVDLEKLQDFYNALNRYYDITKDTTFEGLIKSANANPTEFSKTGIIRSMVDKALKDTNISKETQRAAIKELLGL